MITVGHRVPEYESWAHAGCRFRYDALTGRLTVRFQSDAEVCLWENLRRLGFDGGDLGRLTYGAP